MGLKKRYDNLLSKVSRVYTDWLNNEEDSKFLNNQLVYMGEDKFSSDKLLVSTGYIGCRALVGYDGKEVYLSHILYKETAERFIKKLIPKQRNGGLEVIIVDAIPENESPLKKECESLGLRISDFYPKEEQLIADDGSEVYWECCRSIVVDPKNGMMYVKSIPEVMHKFGKNKKN